MEPDFTIAGLVIQTLAELEEPRTRIFSHKHNHALVGVAQRCGNPASAVYSLQLLTGQGRRTSVNKTTRQLYDESGYDYKWSPGMPLLLDTPPPHKTAHADVRAALAQKNPEAMIHVHAGPTDCALVGILHRPKMKPLAAYSYDLLIAAYQECVPCDDGDLDQFETDAYQWVEEAILGAWHGEQTPFVITAPEDYRVDDELSIGL